MCMVYRMAIENRASWKDSELVKLFIELCIDEVSTRGKQNNSLKRESWANVEKLMLEKKNYKLDQKQLRNCWDYLKKKYRVWSKLVNDSTGHGFDPSTNTMNWSAERWDEYIKVKI